MSLVASGLSPLVLLAQDGAANPLAQYAQFLPIVMIGILFFFMILRPQQAEQKKRDALLKAIKKNDRVLTTGGIFGVVTNVQADVNEVTIRVDEKNDTKLRLQLSAIARVLVDGDSGDSKSEVKN